MPRGVRAGSRQVALQSVSSIDMVGYRYVGLPVAAEIQVIAAVANGERRHPGVGGPAGQDVGSAAAVEMLVMQVDDDAAVLPMCQVFGGEAADLPAAPPAVSVGGGEQVERPAFVCEFRVGEETHAPPAGRVRRVGDAHGVSSRSATTEMTTREVSAVEPSMPDPSSRCTASRSGRNRSWVCGAADPSRAVTVP